MSEGAGMRERTYKQRLKRIDAPMAPRVRVLRAPPEVKTYAAADGPNGIIYRQGPLDRLTMAHEQYHLLDSQVMTDADRARFARIMGFAGQPWDVGHSSAYGDSAGTEGYRGSLSERFADMAALVATKRDPRARRVDAGYMDRMPSRRQLLRFGRALERMGDRYGLAEYKRPRFREGEG